MASCYSRPTHLGEQGADDEAVARGDAYGVLVDQLVELGRDCAEVEGGHGLALGVTPDVLQSGGDGGKVGTWCVCVGGGGDGGQVVTG